MSNELEKLKNSMREKRRNLLNNEKVVDKPFSFSKFMSKLLITVILTMFVLIGIKTHTGFKEGFYNKVFNTTFSFATVNKWYQDFFGSPLPFQNLFSSNIKPVFNETLTYNEKEAYLEGVKLNVGDKYLIPAMDPGIVIFIGDKEEYGNTLIVQQIDGTDVWYSNVANFNVSLYDFVEKGSLIGEVNENELYLVFEKDGEFLDYNEYIQ